MASNHNTENISKQHRRSSKIEPAHFPPIHNGIYYQTGGIKTIKVLATYIIINLGISDSSEFMGKTFQAAQLTHERFLTIDHSCKIFF